MCVTKAIRLQKMYRLLSKDQIIDCKIVQWVPMSMFFFIYA